VFRNPPEASAGQLIDSLDLKGYRVGGASVSELHANFIVNDGTATAADVIAIIMHIRERVKENYGWELQPEIRFIGFS
ncbi:MAG: UDP-N-acetylenolpyruvoylglucosamine reductase, partial [Coriobacteriales bacterium]|nr:UDP-N-acetylenolpyruvoylglucosamine reductase [Coriobacteriales bacterium]